MLKIHQYIIVCSLLLVTISGRLFSQNEAEIPTFGVKAGILLSTVTGDEAIDQYAKKLGAQIGVTGAVYFNPRISLRAELNYELKGGKFNNHELKMDLHYATLPIYAKFSFSRDPEIYIYGGAYASYLIAASTKGNYIIELGDDKINEPINENIYKNLTKYDIGVIGGIGAQGRFNRWLDIFIDFRYTQGFINLNNNNADLRYNFNETEFWPEKMVDRPKNKAFFLTTGFIFFIDPR